MTAEQREEAQRRAFENSGAPNDEKIMGSSLDFNAVTGVQYYTDAAWTYAQGFVNVASARGS